MWKELIDSFYQYVLTNWWEDPIWIGTYLQFNAATYHLPCGKTLTLKLSDTNYIREMVAVETAAYHGETAWGMRDILFDMTHNLQSVYIQGFIDQQLIGFIGLRQDADDVHITNIVVHPTMQSQGIGHIFLYEAQSLAIQMQRQQLSLEVRLSNTRAQSFYKHHGFEIVAQKPHYYKRGHEDALVMIWKWGEPHD